MARTPVEGLASRLAQRWLHVSACSVPLHGQSVYVATRGAAPTKDDSHFAIAEAFVVD